MKDSTKNSKPLAPSSTEATASSSARPKVAAPERGARYGIRVNYTASIDPAAGATQSNGRIIKSAKNRQSPSFSEGAANY